MIKKISKIKILLRLNGQMTFSMIAHQMVMLNVELGDAIEELETLVEADEVSVNQSAQGVKYYRLPGDRLGTSKDAGGKLETEATTESLLDTLTRVFTKEDDTFTTNGAVKASGLKPMEVKELISQMLKDGTIKEAGKGKYMGKPFTKYKIL